MPNKNTKPPTEPYVDATGKPIPPENFDNDMPAPDTNPPAPGSNEEWLDEQIKKHKPKR